MAARAGAPHGLAAALLVAWLGMAVHHAADLPDMPPLAPEYVAPAVVSVALWLLWWRRSSPTARGLILGYALLQLVGGAILSVLPLPIWPFVPAQTFCHYAFHGVYGLAQLPLVVSALRSAR